LNAHDTLAAALAAAALLAAPVAAETLRTEVALSTADQVKTDAQPADGMTVTYPATLTGGDFDGCTAQVVETLYPRDQGSWGLYEVDVAVACGAADGFSFTSSGSWDARGFHGGGAVTPGSGSGRFDGLNGRLAQSSRSITPAADGSLDMVYDLLIDRVSP
jgi:hypothetical protein